MAGVDALGILPGDWSRNYGGTNLLAVVLAIAAIVIMMSCNLLIWSHEMHVCKFMIQQAEGVQSCGPEVYSGQLNLLIWN
jgi:hypothetical protein